MLQKLTWGENKISLSASKVCVFVSVTTTKLHTPVSAISNVISRNYINIFMTVLELKWMNVKYWNNIVFDIHNRQKALLYPASVGLILIGSQGGHTRHTCIYTVDYWAWLQHRTSFYNEQDHIAIASEAKRLNDKPKIICTSNRLHY